MDLDDYLSEMTLTERINLAIDWIEKHQAFDMTEWGDDPRDDDDTSPICGTPACIAGVIYLRVTEQDGPYSTASSIARRFLDLTPSQASLLFNLDGPDALGGDIPLAYIEARHAVAALKHYRDTGQIDWTVAKIDVPATR